MQKNSIINKLAENSRKLRNKKDIKERNKKTKSKTLLVIIAILCLAVIISFALIAYCNISKNKRISNINKNKEKWKTEALVSPEKASLQPAGYITLQWKSAKNMDEVSGYDVYVDDKKQGSVKGDTTTFEYYTTKVSSHEVYIVANLKHGGKIYSDIFTFYVNKKGFCLNKNMAANVDATKWNVSWYYNWSLYKHNYTSFQNLQFVPMFWTSAPTDANEIEVLPKLGYKYLLTFNEPDREDQSNMSVETAIEGITPLLNKGMYVGSPAAAVWPSVSTDWFQPFMEQMEEKKMEVDFICLHHYWNWYDEKGVQAFLDIIDETWEMYHKPIWITEFALSGVPARTKQMRQSAIDYMKGVLPELDKREYVERYAWFSFNPSDYKNGGSALLDTYTGEITDLGKVYQKLGTPEGYGNKKQVCQKENKKNDLAL
jgi:hypothetical protein